MNKAFIFDMDGVLVDSERAWGGREIALLEDLLGHEFASQLGDTIIGTSIRDTYERAVARGASISWEEYQRRYDETAKIVLREASISKGLEKLGEKLLSLDYKLGLVSSSPRRWIDQVIPRLPFRDALEVIISLTDTPALKRKPYPDGYIEALRTLHAEPAKSIILEDSNPGIQSAKASGTYVIGYRENLVPGYSQTDADEYADTIEDVVRIVERRSIPQ